MKGELTMPEQKNCFIIMPLTTPDTMFDKYRDGKDHFKHVLDCLFVPSIKQAGYNPIPPIAKGSDLIHADIINNLETADIILCDMSCLNPNVFFEFGIRTSLNKPVCVVKDELTQKVPFDTGILNYQEYQSSIDPWLIEAEIKRISDHIKTSVERSKGENTLWKYFGLKTEAAAYRGEIGADDKLEYLTMQIDSMREKIDTLAKRPRKREHDFPEYRETSIAAIVEAVMTVIPPTARLSSIRREGQHKFLILYNGEASREDEARIDEYLFDKLGVRSRSVNVLSYPAENHGHL
jgi:hypothetical protein